VCCVSCCFLCFFQHFDAVFLGWWPDQVAPICSQSEFLCMATVGQAPVKQKTSLRCAGVTVMAMFPVAAMFHVVTTFPFFVGVSFSCWKESLSGRSKGRFSRKIKRKSARITTSVNFPFFWLPCCFHRFCLQLASSVWEGTASRRKDSIPFGAGQTSLRVISP